VGETLNGTDFWSDRAISDDDLMASLHLMAPITGAIGTDFWSGQNARKRSNHLPSMNNRLSNTSSNTYKTRYIGALYLLCNMMNNTRNTIEAGG
jgi:hypothetical protein